MPIGKWLIIKGYDKKRERAPPDPNAPPKAPPPPPKEVPLLAVPALGTLSVCT
jgi:hypothetical protein